VSGGPRSLPGGSIRRGARAAGADLVVVEWNGKVGAERTRVLREILAGSPPPLLLLRAPAPTKTRNT
jgi:hypothetical protein